MLPCSEKNLYVQVVIAVWVTGTNKILSVASLKDGKVSSNVEYSIDALITKSIFLSVTLVLKCGAI